MNLISIFLILVCFGSGTEDSELPKNEAGKIQFEEEVVIENLTREDLYRNALNYVSSLKKETKKKSDIAINHGNKVVEKKGSFFVYTQGLLTPQIHGEIKYNVRIQVFDGKYKYTFSDFVFQYYKRNRYGRYTPVNGKTKKLEEKRFAGMQKIWQKHKATTKEFVENQISHLKNKMAELPQGSNTAFNHHNELQYND